MHKTSVNSVREQVLEALENEEASFLITGAPRSGKTTLALTLAVEGARKFGSECVTLAVSNRVVADEANRTILRELRVSGQRRLATTLSAVAFRILQERQLLLGKTAPRLLNGAEQTAVLHSIFDRHTHHARTGELCETCMLLREYFVGTRSGEDSTTLSLFENYITPVFLLQLRDMFARMNELGASHTLEKDILAAVQTGEVDPQRRHHSEHLALQLRMAYALRAEYVSEIGKLYPDEARFDASRLLREAALSVRDDEGITRSIPKLLIVDDAQELTLAGAFLIGELQKAGTRLVLLGNPDESVLGFRGAFGDFVWDKASRGTEVTSKEGFLPEHFAHLHATRLDLESGYGNPADLNYRETIAARVALNIPAQYPTDIPLPKRAQKFPDENASLVRTSHALDGSADGHLFHSKREETEYLLRQIMAERGEKNRSWNDMAIIVHDNVTARSLGARLQQEGIPVQFSDVSTPLSEDPVVQGLFAPIELGRMSVQDEGLEASIRRISLLIHEFAASPFGRSYAKAGPHHQMNDRHIDALLHAVENVVHAYQSKQAVAQNPEAFEKLAEEWDTICHEWGADRGMDSGALKALLIVGSKEARQEVLSLLHAMDTQQSPDMQMLERMLRMVDAARTSAANEADAIMTLWNVWQAADVAQTWQSKALDFSDFAARLTYNAWLDSAMRLFDYADQKTNVLDVAAFMRHVQGLEIAADSLAELAPVQEALTITTPASTAGRAWAEVWMPGLQQGTWPNLAVRNTMFGADDLADLMLTGSSAKGPRDHMLDVLHAEKRSFLVAMTRASERVHCSAVWDDENAPSDFLFTFMPEVFERVSSLSDAEFTDVPVVHLHDDENADEAEGLSNVSDVIRQARVTLSEEVALGGEELSERGRDALAALVYLREQGYTDADPQTWNFTTEPDEKEKAQDNAPVRLSPSAVESMWGCPICFRLDKKFSGPQGNTTATSFGTLIHDVAEWASSEERLDSQDVYESGMKELGSAGAVEAHVAHLMLEQYEKLRTEPSLDDGVDTYLKEVTNDRQASEIFSNIAHYFVHSHEVDLATDIKKHREYLPLTGVQTEKEFDAIITLEDIRYAYNSIPDRSALNRKDFVTLMELLVGGMPSGFSSDIQVQLHGFIDRVEEHGNVFYLVDFKTGEKGHGFAQQFTNLQLVCYQLGLVFDKSRGAHDTEEERAALLATAPDIPMSVLFDVKEENVPAFSYSEGFMKYQPSLFEDGHLAFSSATRTQCPRHRAKLWKGVAFEQDVIAALVDTDRISRQAYERIADELLAQDTDRTLWALSMIARVFYAASALRSPTITVHEVHSEHNTKNCKYKDICTACANAENSVMEEWL
ncbi:PD-(D/E)XK nuclease family protein [Alloscardovia macacae]|uniref:PD-(D/E)XK nuclease superfamily n=1 Tax=Alloscardovia macacae TaxID=1160091 RepID=A0A261F545_9BIFI|nr:PD-(D/E)XK nuclease family protein [Alloscardovia macacae]OZG54231.1 PD-(D/E)XK nuclease superfamily [Alloscardovia macacae]